MHCTLLNFREKIDLDISYESSTSRQFTWKTWNVIPYLVSKTATNFKSVVCLIRSVLLSRKKCVILSTQTQDTWYVYMLQNKVYTRQLKLCTKLHNTEPDICDLWHAKSIYFRSTDVTYTVTFPFTQVGVAFLIYESNQDRPCDFVMSCWQSLRSWIGLSMVVFQRQ